MWVSTYKKPLEEIIYVSWGFITSPYKTTWHHNPEDLNMDMEVACDMLALLFLKIAALLLMKPWQDISSFQFFATQNTQL